VGAAAAEHLDILWMPGEESCAADPFVASDSEIFGHDRVAVADAAHDEQIAGIARFTAA
jgi:hypothetical protein